MMCPATRKLMAIAIFASSTIICQSQPNNPHPVESAAVIKTETKPFKVLTNGRQITIRSIKEIKSMLVWTASGHRILEEKDVNSSSYTFNITIPEKIFFVMVQLQNGKLYTEKIGIR